MVVGVPAQPSKNDPQNHPSNPPFLFVARTRKKAEGGFPLTSFSFKDNYKELFSFSLQERGRKPKAGFP